MGVKDKIQDIESLFLDLDHEKKIAYVNRNYERPSDIIEFEGYTKTPLLKEEYIEWLSVLFSYAPKKYKLNITVSFDDLEGHDIKELEDISHKNLLLEILIQSRKMEDQNSMALLLCGIGIAVMVLYYFVNNFWNAEGPLYNLVLYVIDILATVPFWAAADIFFVGNSEQREAVKSFRERFNPITYKLK